jgi:hypothetical protein
MRCAAHLVVSATSAVLALNVRFFAHFQYTI